MIKTSEIRTDGGTQSRASINPDTVAEYAEAMADPNTVFPPIIVYHDGKDYWLADGFHRVAAWKQIGREEVPAEIRQGDRRKAVLHSCAANSAHGLRRTNADKRRAVMTLLEDDEWSKWSNREIARRCAVSDRFVGNLRGDLSANGSQIADARTVERGGKAYQQNTAYIGKGRSDLSANGLQISDTRTVDQPAAPAPVVDQAPADPYGYGKLSADGLLDEATGLRQEVEDLREKTKAQNQEIAGLKDRIKELSSSDQGRVISNLQEQLRAVKLKRDDAMTEAKRADYRMKKAVKERDEAVANQVVSLN